jgi:thioredoxin 1
MEKGKSSVHKEKITVWLFISFVVIFFSALIAFKGKLNSYVSESLQSMVLSSEKAEVTSYIDSAYNYIANKKSFEVTFLEIGSKMCSSCKHMESVMKEIRFKYPDKVNVVFIDIMEPENQNLIKYFGIALIPAQVLLDKNGKEFFRHSDYISTFELEGEIFKK